jgi:hypothetical protein
MTLSNSFMSGVGNGYWSEAGGVTYNIRRLYT